MPPSASAIVVAHLAVERAATLADLLALGVSEPTVRRLRRDGVLCAVGRGVLGLADDPDPRRRDRIGLQLLHPGSVLSHQTAAELYGLPIQDRRVHLILGPGGRAHGDRVVVHRTNLLPDVDLATLEGQATTGAARTVCDLAAVASTTSHYRWLVQESILSGVVTPASLLDRADALAVEGRTGTRRRRTVLEELFADGPLVGDTRLEREFRLLVRAAGLRVVMPFVPPWFDGTRGVVDAAIPDHRLIIELDGRRWHATLERFNTDRARDRQAAEAGWRVLRFTWGDLRLRPGSVVASIEAACAS